MIQFLIGYHVDIERGSIAHGVWRLAISKSSGACSALLGARLRILKLMQNPKCNLMCRGKKTWRTKIGKKSSFAGERYLLEAAIKTLASGEYAATTRAKRKAKRESKQSSK